MIIGQSVTVQPAGGQTVKKPDGTDLAAGGEVVIASAYWQRRVADGSVTEVGGVPPAGPIGVGRIVVYDQLADRASATDFGVGVALVKATKTLYICDGNQWTGSVALDSNGDLIANIIPRTDTLANLLATIGSVGELASATDTNALVKFNGTTAGGDVFYAGNNLGGNIGFHLQPVNPVALMNLYSSPVDFLSFGGFTPSANAPKPLFMVAKAAGDIQATFDLVNFFKIDPRAGTTSPKYATDGKRIVSIEAGVNAYYLNAPYSTWGTYTTALHASNTAWIAPMMCGPNSVLTIDNATLGKSALIDTNSDTISLLDLPAGCNLSLANGSLYSLASPQQFKSDSGPFAVIVFTNSSKCAVLKGATAATAAWVAADLPAALTAVPYIVFFGNKVIVCQSGLTTAYLADYDAVNASLGVWQAITLPSAYSVTNYNGQVPHHPHVFALSGTTNGVGNGPSCVFVTRDGKAWQTILVPGTGGPKILPVACGLYLADDISGVDGTMTGWMLHNNLILSQVTAFATASNQNKPIGNSRYANAGANLWSPYPSIRKPHKVAAASSTGTINLAEGTTCSNITTAAQAALTVNLPPNPTVGQEVPIRLVNGHTALTIGTQASPAGQTINGGSTFAAGTNAANQVYRFTYHASNDWSVG